MQRLRLAMLAALVQVYFVYRRAIPRCGVDGCAGAAKEFNTHLQAGANIAGFLKVAEAMQACYSLTFFTLLLSGSRSVTEVWDVQIL